MAWTTIVLVSTGELATAAVHNDQVLGNLNELRTGGLALASQAAGDIFYATGAGQLGRLAKQAAGKVLGSGDTPSWVAMSGGGLAICEGRLTATTGVPVTTSDVNGATSIYYSPYKGNRIALYDGSSAWNVRTFTEITISLVGLTASKNYDVFAYDNAGTVTIETLVWTNDTTRATALTLQDGVLVKTGATTRRYLGTVYINSSGGQTNDALLKRYLWNYYHRVPRVMRVRETTDSWNYTTATWRQARASTANQVEFVIGVAEEPLTAEVLAFASNSSAGPNVRVGIGLDSTTAFQDGCLIPSTGLAAGSSDLYPVQASLKTYPAAGRHYAAWLEYSGAAGTTTWYGDDGAATVSQSGIHGVVNG